MLAMKKIGRENKPHIGIFGRRNNGKSSILNCLAQQDLSIVSDIAGTTTDPVKKSIEIEGVGPAIVIDTAGIDDFGELGEKRNQKSIDTIQIIDLAILVIADNVFGTEERQLIHSFKSNHVPFFILANKSDITLPSKTLVEEIESEFNTSVLSFSCEINANPDPIYEAIKTSMPKSIWNKPSLFGDIIEENDTVLLVTPIDSEAPEGRMILPQVQSIRDVLDNNAICVVLKETQLKLYLEQCQVKPKLVVTDSQMFAEVNSILPDDIPLTSFSIVLARLKGNFDKYLEGTKYISELKDKDKILLLESCTHHVSCEDIGRYKIPNWLKNYTGRDLKFEIVSGLATINNLNDYAMVIQCGGCVITKKQLGNRLLPAIKAGIPVSNYGMTIAYVNGIFERTVAPFV